MKHFSLSLILLFCAVFSMAQSVVTISDPETWTTTEMSAYVGKTVTFDVPFFVCNNYYYSRGQYSIAPRRLYSPTNQEYPRTAEYSELLFANSRGGVTLNGLNEYHRMGEKLVNMVVKVSSTNSWELVSCDFVGNTREEMQAGFPSVDIRDEHNLLVCAFNLEYYLVQNTGSGSMGPANAEMQNRQHTKIMEALTHIQADIFGFVEIEQGQVALNKLAQSLSTATGRHYTYIDDGSTANGTYTKSGYVYCSDVVEPVRNLQSNNTRVQNRKKMQAFRLKENNEVFIFSLNHFKAKSGSGTGLDADQGDGQGIFNNSRVIEANSVLAEYSKNRSYFDDDDILIMGDLNAYAKEDPIMTLINGGMTDLHRYFHADSSYSYTYHGTAGYLDHALANASMLAQVTGMTAYHINSDEDDGFTYNGKTSDLTMFRSSDHDPVIVGLKLGADIKIESRVDIVQIDENIFEVGIIDAAGGYYQIFSVMGVLISEGNITSSQFMLSDLNLPRGILFINLYVNGEVKQFKFMNLQ